MRYLLDSDSLSDLYEPESPGHRNIAGRVVALAKTDSVVVSIVALFEMEYGYARAPEKMKLLLRQRISAVQADSPILPLTLEAARLFGSLKVRLQVLRQLSPKASKAHNIDLMTAATAITEGCTLVSADGIYSDLRRIDHTLRIENWLATA
ncbi:MAG TPA: type II toxin-antitoxin system VapC family toxin [Thermoanaerobaculia bacterium]|nr:type II toxin-antitoxin system VapC family toxin [Thermoanaerobaculia bacterium]